MNLLKNQLESQIYPVDRNKKYVFVSYSSDDYERVYRTVIELQKLGVNIWIDTQLHEHAGVDWQKKVFSTINSIKCKGILYFISKSSIQSAPVLAELAYSSNDDRKKGTRELKFIPISVDDDLIGSIEEWSEAIIEEVGANEITDSERKVIDNAYSITKFQGELLKKSEFDFEIAFEEVYRIITDILRIRFGEKPDEIIRLVYKDVDSILKNIPVDVINQKIKECSIMDKSIEVVKSVEEAKPEEVVKLVEEIKTEKVVKPTEEIETEDAVKPTEEKPIEKIKNFMNLLQEKGKIREEIKEDMTEMEKIVFEYQKHNPHVFEFKIVNDIVRIAKYYDVKERTSIKIPDFVYGVVGNVMLSGPFSKIKYLQEIKPGLGLRDLSYFFAGTKIKELDLSEWDVSKVENMSYMFYSSKLVSIGDISNWDVSNVEYFESMFASSKIKQIGNLSKWTVSKATSMRQMFWWLQAKDIGDLSNWDVSNVLNFTEMFEGAELTDSVNIKNWKYQENADTKRMIFGTKILDK